MKHLSKTRKFMLFVALINVATSIYFLVRGNLLYSRIDLIMAACLLILAYLDDLEDNE